MKYKVGDKVRIVSKKVGDEWDSNEKMNRWLGKVMTVRKVESKSYRMEEDNTEHSGSGWFWYEHMVAGLDEKPQNRMADIPALLDLRLGQKFNIIDKPYNPYKITENGLLDCEGDEYYALLGELLKGNVRIEKLQWIPQHAEDYFFVRANGDIDSTVFNKDNTYDIAMVRSENCFPTYSAAEEKKEAVEIERSELFK